jgi:hypothetical protein
MALGFSRSASKTGAVGQARGQMSVIPLYTLRKMEEHESEVLAFKALAGERVSWQ